MLSNQRTAGVTTAQRSTLRTNSQINDSQSGSLAVREHPRVSSAHGATGSSLVMTRRTLLCEDLTCIPFRLLLLNLKIKPDKFQGKASVCHIIKDSSVLQITIIREHKHAHMLHVSG